LSWVNEKTPNAAINSVTRATNVRLAKLKRARRNKRHHREVERDRAEIPGRKVCLTRSLVQRYATIPVLALRTAGYAHPVTIDEQAEREALLTELLELQNDLEASFVPEVIEPMLSLSLTMQQLKVLAILMTEPDGSTIQALAKTVGVSLATMSGIVDRLESQDMIHRALDPRDQRVRRVTATATGRETVQRLLAGRPELSRTPLNRLALNDLRALTQGIRALLHAMKDLPSEAPSREQPD